MNFWKQFKKPIYVLAPMAGVADSAFRQICKDFGADVLYSEMASVTALAYSPQKTLELIEYDEKEKPYVVQLFGSDPNHFATATKIISGNCHCTDLKTPDGIDINFGCPVKKVQKQGAGAVLMENMKKAKDCIKAVIDNTNLPVSIKTRTQVGDVNVLQFLDYVSDLDIKAFMLHGRTLKQGFSGPIDTEIIKKTRDYFGGFIMANGGINNYEDAERILEETQADGLGIARGAMGRPWIFKEIKERKNMNYSMEEIKKIMIRHARLTDELKGKVGIVELRKHLCWYISGFPGAKELRKELITVNTYGEIEDILNRI